VVQALGGLRVGHRCWGEDAAEARWSRVAEIHCLLRSTVPPAGTKAPAISAILFPRTGP